MDLGPAAAAGMGFCRRRRRWILLLAAAGISSYGAYCAYHHPAVARKRRKLFALLRALFSVADAAAASAETLAVLSSDLDVFLRSDSDEMPQSLKQLAKIAGSDEFRNSVSKLSESLTIGTVRGFQASSKPGSEQGFSDRLVDKVFSAEGAGFTSVVVGSFARNLVLAFYSGDDRKAGIPSGSPAIPTWVSLVCADEYRNLIADCVQRFVSAAVTVYLEKTMGVNSYDELFAGLTNPNHESKVKEMLVSVCNGAVETLVKTSHHVLSTSDSTLSADGMKGCEGRDEFRSSNDGRSVFGEKGKGNGGWVDRLSSTLAVPCNRKLVLDVTGRVTFETVRSFLEFLLWKIYDGARRSVKVVHEEVVERGLDVVRYVSAKSMVIVTMCLTLCMHMLVGTRFLMPA